MGDEGVAVREAKAGARRLAGETPPPRGPAWSYMCAHLGGTVRKGQGSASDGSALADEKLARTAGELYGRRLSGPCCPRVASMPGLDEKVSKFGWEAGGRRHVDPSVRRVQEGDGPVNNHRLRERWGFVKKRVRLTQRRG